MFQERKSYKARVQQLVIFLPCYSIHQKNQPPTCSRFKAGDINHTSQWEVCQSIHGHLQTSLNRRAKNYCSVLSICQKSIYTTQNWFLEAVRTSDNSVTFSDGPLQPPLHREAEYFHHPKRKAHTRSPLLQALSICQPF